MFSTISQSFVALVSLLGMVAIYKIQSIENERQNLTNSLRSGGSLKFFKGAMADSMSYADIKTFLDGLEDKTPNHPQLSACRKAKTLFDKFNEDEKYIINNTKTLLKTSLFLIAYSLSAISLVPYIFNNLLGFIFLSISVIWSLYLVKIAYDFILKLIKPKIIN